MNAAPSTGAHVGMIHTVPALAGTFHDQILAEFDVAERPRIDHIVDPWLLAEATRNSVTDEVADRVAAHATYLAEHGAQVIMLTCSSIGGTAALASERSGIPVLRVDEPMAREANLIAGDGIIAVLATLASTLGPTAELVRSSQTGESTPTIEMLIVEGAAEARANGNQPLHDRLIRDAVERVGDVAVIVLAQASMAPALEGANVTRTPVLTSPPGGVAAFVQAIRSR